jgi:hypothetical protein
MACRHTRLVNTPSEHKGWHKNAMRGFDDQKIGEIGCEASCAIGAMDPTREY